MAAAWDREVNTQLNRATKRLSNVQAEKTKYQSLITQAQSASPTADITAAITAATESLSEATARETTLSNTVTLLTSKLYSNLTGDDATGAAFISSNISTPIMSTIVSSTIMPGAIHNRVQASVAVLDDPGTLDSDGINQAYEFAVTRIEAGL